jgi:hypothetical protein
MSSVQESPNTPTARASEHGHSENSRFMQSSLATELQMTSFVRMVGACN